MFVAACRLPAHEMAGSVAAHTVNPIEVDSPFRASLNWFVTNSLERNARVRIPDLVRFIDPRERFPPRTPRMVKAVPVEIDRQIDPISRGRDFKLPVVSDIFPAITHEHFHDVSIPQVHPRLCVICGLENIQLRIRAAEKYVKVGVGPKGFDGCLGFWIGDLAVAVL